MKRAALAGLLLAAGCTLLAPATDLSRFYVLAPTAEPAAASDLSLGVGPIQLAAYLSAPEIQVRASATEVRHSAIERWAEPLEDGITRVLALDLGAALGTREVVLFPWYADQQPDVQVRLTVQRFELEPDGSGVVEARYEATQLATGRRVIRETTLRRPAASSDTAGSVAALSDALGDLAAEIAAEVRGLGADAAAKPRRAP